MHRGGVDTLVIVMEQEVRPVGRLALVGYCLEVPGSTLAGIN